MKKTTTADQPSLKLVNPSATAIDIGPTMHVAAVNPERVDMPVRTFGAFTHHLHALERDHVGLNHLGFPNQF